MTRYPRTLGPTPIRIDLGPRRHRVSARIGRRRRVDPGVAPTYVGDERLITRSDAEIRRRDAGIHSPSASAAGETVCSGGPSRCAASPDFGASRAPRLRASGHASRTHRLMRDVTAPIYPCYVTDAGG